MKKLFLFVLVFVAAGPCVTHGYAHQPADLYAAKQDDGSLAVTVNLNGRPYKNSDGSYQVITTKEVQLQLGQAMEIYFFPNDLHHYNSSVYFYSDHNDLSIVAPAEECSDNYFSAEYNYQHWDHQPFIDYHYFSFSALAGIFVKSWRANEADSTSLNFQAYYDAHEVRITIPITIVDASASDRVQEGR